MIVMSSKSISYPLASSVVNWSERSFVNPTNVVLVEPDAIDVEPRVGAEYPATVPHDGHEFQIKFVSVSIKCCELV